MQALRLRTLTGQTSIVHRRCWLFTATQNTSRSFATISAADLRFGQPLHETHPHILKSGQLTPGITALEYAERRTKLANSLPRNALAVIAAADIKDRSKSTFYEFHQNSDFFYLTGFNEPEALAVIGPSEHRGDHSFQLFVREKDEKAEKWEGARSGTQAALDVFNADSAHDISRVGEVLPRLVKEAALVYTDIIGQNTNSAFSRFLFGTKPKNGGLAKVLEGVDTRSLHQVLNPLRLIKSDAEIRNMRAAGKATGRAHTKAMRRSFNWEKSLDAFLEYHLREEGCDCAAFEPVVAGATNALSIHYVRNDDVLREGDLVLVDCGGEYGGYIADITRTWPVSGRFTSAQKDLYEAVLKVQRSCISLCRQNAHMSLDKLHKVAEESLQDQLQHLGFNMSGRVIDTLFPHHIGHFIGIDLHDTPQHPRRNLLEAGNCIAVEPGIYVPVDDRWPKHFQGLGIRIEDSVCIKEEHPYVLTTEAVKEVVDIEALRD